MGSADSWSNLGTPVPVDVDSIERELAGLWKSAPEAGEEGAVIRACSCNLVVIAEDRVKASALLPVLARVSEWRPARFLVAFRESPTQAAQTGPDRMDAWISAQCSLPLLGKPQICSEVITVAATGGASANLPDTLLSLLVPDLQAYLYWRSFRQEDWEWVQRIARFSNLLIVDSHQSRDDPEHRRRVLKLLTESPTTLPVRDLNWSRLTAWRDLIAQFFDTPADAGEAYRISHVEIDRSLGAPGNIPTRTLLLTGWLASRLGWRRISAQRISGEWISRWQSGSGEVVVQFTGRPAVADQPPGISAITLRTRGGNTLSVVRDTGSSVLKATSSGSRHSMSHSVPQESMDEADLLIGELSLSGEDLGFRAALAEAVGLEMEFAR